METTAKVRSSEDRCALRREHAVPILSEFGAWLEREEPAVQPKSPIGEVPRYARNQWAALNVYITDDRLAIDNNAAKRAVKPYAIGRKNWLFFGNDHSGRRLAILSSFTVTCQQCGVNPWT